MADYPHTWVLVADASRARIFEWTAPSRLLLEIADPVNPQGRLKSSALDSDKPGIAADAQGHRSGHPMQAARSAHEKSAKAFAEQIAAKAPLAVAAIKEIATSTAVLSEQAAFALLRSGKLEHDERMLKSDDSLEGARAFNQKRPPVWRGR